jgi:hypothetical protein
MGKGTSGFRRARTGLQNIKSHRSAPRLVDFDLVKLGGALDTYNHPMLELERDILQDLRISPDSDSMVIT